MKIDHHIRHAKQEDIPSMIRLVEQLFSIETDFSFDPSNVEKALKQLIEKESSAVFVCDREGEILGMVTCQLVMSTSEGGHSCWIEDLIVDKPVRRTGIAEKLLSNVYKWAEQRSATRLQILADKNNIPALFFYQKAGWHSTQMICLRKFL